MKKLSSLKQYNISKSCKYTIYYLKPKTSILKFRPQKHNITDKDIMSLLMGVIKLVRDSERSRILQDLEDQLK